jgi:hypothetical protein
MQGKTSLCDILPVVIVTIFLYTGDSEIEHNFNWLYSRLSIIRGNGGENWRG